MEIKVYGQSELEEIYLLNKKIENFDYLISITDPSSLFERKKYHQETPEIFNKSFKKILKLKFLDLSTTEGHEDGHKLQLPTRSDVEKAIEFYKEVKELKGNIIIHCYAGISRSTAMTLGLLSLDLKSEDLAVDKLIEIRKQADPNSLILEIFDSILGTNLKSRKKEIQSRLLKEFSEKFKKMFPEEVEYEDITNLF